MEQNFTITLNPTFPPNQSNQLKNKEMYQLQQTDNVTQTAHKMNKNKSEPKMRSYKQQILRIPKVKQILNKDKHIYKEDIEKRLQLIGTLKNQNYVNEEIVELHGLTKQKSLIRLKSQKKSSKKQLKRHKTNFKIPLTRKNIQSLNTLVVQNIDHNLKYKNQQTIFLKQYSQNAPFDLQQLSFMDKIDKIKIKYKEKFPQFNEKVLSKNKLVLENVILNRNIKRELKLDQKKLEKKNQKNIMALISEKLTVKK